MSAPTRPYPRPKRLTRSELRQKAMRFRAMGMDSTQIAQRLRELYGANITGWIVAGWRNAT